MTPPLRGFTIGVTGDRRADEQIELLTRRGASIVHGPTIEISNLRESPELSEATRSLLERAPDMVVATTGVGMRSWFEAADGLGLGDSLRSTLTSAELVSRSPKASGAAVTIGFNVSWQAEGERTNDVANYLSQRDLNGVRIAVQRDGSGVDHLARQLRDLGAEVIDAPIYRWKLPTNRGPANRLLDQIANRELDAITITSSPALINLIELANQRDDSEAILEGLTDPNLLLGSVGPACTETAQAVGMVSIVQPQRFRLGSMVKVLTEALSSTAWTARLGGVQVRVQGASVMVDEQERLLPRRQQQLLQQLHAADGAVVSKAELARQIWGAGSDPHVVEVTIGRLRQNLGSANALVDTVARRGYRINA